jgi:hypothetical protein
MYVQTQERSDFSILDGRFLNVVEERRQIVATQEELQPRDIETTYCCRVAAKILRLIDGFRHWRMAHGESDWVKASVSWVVERLVNEYPNKMVRRGLALLERLGIVDRILSSEAKIPGKGRWKNPCLTWFYKIKIDLDVWMESTEASKSNSPQPPGSISPKQYHISPNVVPESSQNSTTVVEKNLISRKEKIDQKIISLTEKLAARAQKEESATLTPESSEQADIPAGVEELINDDVDVLANNLTHDQIIELEDQRQPELQQIEDLRVDLHPKLMRLILAVNVNRLRDAIAAMKQQFDNKRQKGERLRDPSGFLELAIRNGYQPNKKSESWGQNGSANDFKPDLKHTNLNSLQKLYPNRDAFIEAAQHFGHDDQSIFEYLENLK